LCVELKARQKSYSQTIRWGGWGDRKGKTAKLGQKKKGKVLGGAGHKQW